MSTLYREIAEIPLPTAARFVSPDAVHVTLVTRDHVKNTRYTSCKTVILTPQFVATPALEISNVVLSGVSTSGARTAHLKEESDASGKGKKRWVQVWKGDLLEAEMDVTEKHGAFYGDDFISSLSFSPSETTLVYTAEANPPKAAGDDAELDFEEFIFTPQLGEGFGQRRKPTLFAFHWQHNTSTDAKPVLTTLKYDSPTYLGQAIFVNEHTVVATGYDLCSDGRCLGIKYCLNRLSGLWELKIPSENLTDKIDKTELSCTTSKLVDHPRSVRSPRVFKGDGDNVTLFWLSNELGGAHASCTSLRSIDLRTKKEKIIIDDVAEATSPGQFPGLYSDGFNLPVLPFLRMSSKLFIVVSSGWGSRNTVLLIDAESASVNNMTPEEDYSWTVLGTDGKKRVLATRSSLKKPHELVLGSFDEGRNISWEIIEKPVISKKLENELANLELSVVQIPNSYPLETILLRKPPATVMKGNGLPPLLSVLHGGPHGCNLISFSAMHVARALEGFTLSMPNYTGSTNFGKKYVDELLGKVGRLDVSDCMASIRHLIDIGVAQEGPGKQLVQGGSHGGFLTAHFIGQYPDFFSAASLRNPVINLGESISDIPDWYFSESGVPYPFTTPPPLMTPDLYQRFWKASPISYVDKVKTPVLLLIGNDDVRVAPTQGMGYYHALKARGQTVTMLCFPGESHAIEGVKAARVSWEAEHKLLKEKAVF